MIFILIKLLIKLYCIRQKKKLPILRFTKMMNIICFIFAILVSSLDLSHIVISKILDIPVISPWFVIKIPVMTLADIIYFLLSISVYILIIGRSYFAFQETMYKLSNMYLSFILFLIILAFTSMIFYVYYLYNDFELIPDFIWIQLSIELVINISVLSLFIYKLRQQALLMQSFEKMNLSQISLINVITKHSSLGCVLIICNPMFYVAGSLQIYVAPNHRGTTIGFYMRIFFFYL